MAAELFLKSAKTGKQIGPIASGDVVGRVSVQRAIPSEDLAFFGFSQFVVASRESGGWTIRPCDRTVMTTYLNGTEVVAESPLKDGDVISVGSRTNTAMRRGDLQVVFGKMAAVVPCPLPGSSYGDVSGVCESMPPGPGLPTVSCTRIVCQECGTSNVEGRLIVWRVVRIFGLSRKLQKGKMIERWEPWVI